MATFSPRLDHRGRYVASNCGKLARFSVKKYSLSTLLFVLTATAIGLSTWNQYKQSKRIDLLERTLTHVENNCRIRARINDFLVHESPDSEAFQILGTLLPPMPDKTLDREDRILIDKLSSNAQLVDVDGEPGGLEILSLSTVFHTIPGDSRSVNVLFDDQRIVDIVVRKTGTRYETHHVALTDVTGDNAIELILECTPGFLSDQKPAKLVYLATKSGFQNYGIAER